MKTFLISTKIFLVFTLLTGIAYPLFVTGIAQVAFPSKANGSLITIGNKVVGSELIGQSFDSCVYFMPRPSAINYDAACSGGSNLGMTSSKLKQQVNDRSKAFISFNQLDSMVQIPSEMLYASGSGLDPHISVKAALLQVDRIAAKRHLNDTQKQSLQRLISEISISGKDISEDSKIINVLQLNIKLDKL